MHSRVKNAFRLLTMVIALRSCPFGDYWISQKSTNFWGLPSSSSRLCIILLAEGFSLLSTFTQRLPVCISPAHLPYGSSSASLTHISSRTTEVNGITCMATTQCNGCRFRSYISNYKRVNAAYANISLNIFHSSLMTASLSKIPNPTRFELAELLCWRAQLANSLC